MARRAHGLTFLPACEHQTEATDIHSFERTQHTRKIALRSLKPTSYAHARYCTQQQLHRYLPRLVHCTSMSFQGQKSKQFKAPKKLEYDFNVEGTPPQRQPPNQTPPPSATTAATGWQHTASNTTYLGASVDHVPFPRDSRSLRQHGKGRPTLRQGDLQNNE